MKNSTDGLWHFNFREQKMICSDGLFEILRTTAKEFLHLSEIHRLIHPLDKFKWELAVNQASLGGPSSTFDSLMTLDNGMNIWVRHSVASYIQEGESVGLQGICTDVTDFKIRELERKVDKHFR